MVTGSGSRTMKRMKLTPMTPPVLRRVRRAVHRRLGEQAEPSAQDGRRGGAEA
jgi:hypothetical protein